MYVSQPNILGSGNSRDANDTNLMTCLLKGAMKNQWMLKTNDTLNFTKRAQGMIFQLIISQRNEQLDNMRFWILVWPAVTCIFRPFLKTFVEFSGLSMQNFHIFIFLL